MPRCGRRCGRLAPPSACRPAWHIDTCQQARAAICVRPTACIAVRCCFGCETRFWRYCRARWDRSPRELPILTCRIRIVPRWTRAHIPNSPICASVPQPPRHGSLSAPEGGEGNSRQPRCLRDACRAAAPILRTVPTDKARREGNVMCLRPHARRDANMACALAISATLAIAMAGEPAHAAATLEHAPYGTTKPARLSRSSP